MRLRKSVATYNDLPLSDNFIGDVRATLDTASFYIWTSQSDTGSLADWKTCGGVGQIGPTGPTGAGSNIDNIATYNIFIAAFKLLQSVGTTFLKIINGRTDYFLDELGVDTGLCINQIYLPNKDQYTNYLFEGFRYYRLHITDSNETWVGIGQIEIYNGTTLLTPNNMSADDVPSPYVCSALSSYEGDSNWRKYYAFDSLIGTSPGGGMGWHSNSVLPTWIKLDLGITSLVPTSYKIYAPWYNYCPRDWTLEGSDTGEFNGEEFIIDTQSDVDDWPVDTAKTFPITTLSAGTLSPITLISTKEEIVTIPTEGLFLCLVENVDLDSGQEILPNTDVIASLSNDDGDTWTQVTLEEYGYYDSLETYFIFAGNIIFPLASTGHTGKEIRWKIETSDTYEINVKGAAFYARE